MNECSTTSHPLWHPFADTGAVDGHRTLFASTQAAWVGNDSGAFAALDGGGELWCGEAQSHRFGAAGGLERDGAASLA